MMQRIARTTLAAAAVAAVSLGTMATAQAGPTASSSVDAQELSCWLRATPEEARARTSPLKELEFTFDGGAGLLCYSAPSARGREVVGGLVPLGQPWRTGANEPTTLHISAPLTVGGVELEPGSYSIYTVPGEGEWQVFFNTNYERWGIPINADVRATEVGSATVAAGETDGMVEMLTFSHDGGMLVMEWENTRLEIPIG